MDAQKQNQFKTRKKKKVCMFCADKIEHIDTFVEAVRRFPGKICCSA